MHAFIVNKGSTKNFQKMKKKTQVFIQTTSVPNFNMIRPILTSLGCPKILEKNGSQGPKKRDFQKIHD